MGEQPKDQVPKEEQQPKDQASSSVGFLLAEYQGYRDSFWHTEELGERRVDFFITITTAVIAALAIREKGILVPEGQAVDPIFFLGLGAVLLFGVVTLARMVHRNLKSHEYLRAAARVRRYFVDRDQHIRPHLFYPPYDDRPRREKRWSQLLSLGTGGLVETVALVNSLIAAVLGGLLTFAYPGWAIGLSAIGAFVLAWVVQFAYVRRRYEKEGPTADEIEFPGD